MLDLQNLLIHTLWSTDPHKSLQLTKLLKNIAFKFFLDIGIEVLGVRLVLWVKSIDKSRIFRVKLL